MPTNREKEAQSLQNKINILLRLKGLRAVATVVPSLDGFGVLRSFSGPDAEKAHAWHFSPENKPIQ